MSRSVRLPSLLLAALSLRAVAAGPDQASDIADQLKRYYADTRKVPPYEVAVKRLASDDMIERSDAAEYLRALLDQTFKDECCDKAPPMTGLDLYPFSDNSSRNLRQHVAVKLRLERLTPAALPVIRWFLDEEFLDEPLVDVMSALSKLDGKEADELRVGLVAKPHADAVVVVEALKQITERELTVPADKLLPLCQHYRPSIRAAARKLNKLQGARDPDRLDLGKAMQLPGMRKLLADFRELHLEPLPDPIANKKEADIEEAVKKVEQALLSGKGKCRAGLNELYLASALDEAKRPELAGRVLFSALDSYHRDEDLLQEARYVLSEKHGVRMLSAFVYSRDYDKTEATAKFLVKNFPGTHYHQVASHLLEELPKRRDDFVKWTLPTPAEWGELKKKLTRAEQIDFLCKRFRLLNSPVFSRAPYTTESTSKQYAEPIATWGDKANKGKTEVINPYTELIYDADLKASDIVYLAPHLKENWQLLMVDYKRMTLIGTPKTSRSLVAELINKAAKRELCDPEAFEKLTVAERDEEIRRLIEWAKKNPGKDEK
jgi:hypothetical protein